MEFSFDAILRIALHFVGLHPKFYIFRAAGFAYPWLAFIPVVCTIVLAFANGYIYWNVAGKFNLGVGQVLSPCTYTKKIPNRLSILFAQ